jgi:transposase
MGRKRTRRRLTRGFKLEAVRQALVEGRSQVEVARELGLNPETLYRWTREFKADPKQSFPGLGNLKDRDKELESLRRENARLKGELSFLKKVSAYLAKNPR